MNDHRLFRQAVLNHKKNLHYGTVSLNRPVPYKWFIIAGTLLLISLFIVILLTEFTEHCVVNGYLNSTAGLIRLYPKRAGFIKAIYKQQGEVVKQGEAIFLIGTPYDEEELLYKQLRDKKKALIQELTDRNKALNDLKPLVKKGYMSLNAYQTKRHAFNELKIQYQQVKVDILRHKKRQEYVILAPKDGIMASIIAHEGHAVNLEKPLATLLPDKAQLIAELWVPPRQAAFLQQANEVVIRYDAYPYARFGTAKAVITSISQSLFTDEDDDKPIRLNEPYYKVTAALERPFVNGYGKKEPLRHGMTLSAVLIGSRRAVWQWVLQPLGKGRV